jgi:hypothetical protein
VTRLNAEARATIKTYAPPLTTIRAYCRWASVGWPGDPAHATFSAIHAHCPPDHWHGDACGCTDDRCIGFHHDPDEPCGCLPVLLADFVKVAPGA